MESRDWSSDVCSSDLFPSHDIPHMKFIDYLKETKAELKQVVFPTTSTTIVYTMLVIMISVVTALILSGVDLGLRELLSKLLNH